MENVEFNSQSIPERDPHLPLIDPEEQRFIEETGGDYAGYIRADGRKRYERFRVGRCAHYDEEQRAVVETYIATEAIDPEGEKEMNAPEDAFGFSIMIGQLARSGEELARPEIIPVRPSDFKGKQQPTNSELEDVARKIHAFAIEHASLLNRSELSMSVKQHLRSIGWTDGR
jgi:hypothetical protein